ncbi:MAG: hypothetical protein RIQ81_1500 [Pseudomonadota bacterium]
MKLGPRNPVQRIPRRLLLGGAGLALAVSLFFTFKFLEAALARRAAIKIGQRLNAIERSIGVRVRSEGFKAGFGGLKLDSVEITIPASGRTTQATTNHREEAENPLETVDLLRKIEPALKNIVREFGDTTSRETGIAGKAWAWFLPRRVTFDIEELLIVTARPGNKGEFIPGTRETVLRASGFHVRIDRRKPRIHYHARRLLLAGMMEESMLSGHMRVWNQTGVFEFTAIKGPHHSMGMDKGAWYIRTLSRLDGREMTAEIQGNHMPRMIATMTRGIVIPSADTTFQANATFKRLGEKMISFASSAKVSDLYVQSKILAPGTIGPVRLTTEVSGTFEPARGELIIDHGRVELPAPVDFEPLASGMAQRSHHDFAVDAGTEPAIIVSFQAKGGIHTPRSIQRLLMAHFPGPVLPASDQWGFKAFVARTPCQALVDILPQSLAPALRKFQLGGDFMGMLSVEWPAGRPEEFKGRLTHPEFSCAVEQEPFEYAASNYTGPVKVVRSSRGMPVREITLSPDNASWTPIDAVSPAFLKAIVAAEDAGFWSHHGIEPAGFVDALRDNLTERKLARGGSTITMQLVKNLMLSQERTASRKIQELFLAWHLGNSLPRSRVLELYVNLVEMGPNVFGVTEAAQSFFGKTPAQLTLKESVFLANLLPAPLPRVEAFCRHMKPTPNFTGLMNDLIARMEYLKVISPAQARATLNDEIKFRTDEAAIDLLCKPVKEAS